MSLTLVNLFNVPPAEADPVQGDREQVLGRGRF
jgi:hypothetical protein